jgi:hypothetical protein
VPVFLLGGGLFLVVGVVHGYETWKLGQRKPQAVTAAELGQKDYIKSAPDWISYTFAESQPTKLTVKRQRLEIAGEVAADCLLVRVGDKWLAATVAPGFEGNTVVGRLVRLDSPGSKTLLERLGKLKPKPAALLPYEFIAVDGCASDQQTRYTEVAVLAIVGFLGLLLGVYLLRSGRRPAPKTPDPAIAGWTVHPVPNR